ncbi:ATP-binding protein [Aquimarina hainanensis]|uniref:histidine kinase n=1 Tax=Aquimarina hainanensis TaxID=1578017 RepID=A0ABW5NG35_9FLAO
MSQNVYYKSATIKYTLYGILFGCGFPILATIIEINKLGLDFSWSSIFFVQKNNSLLYIIDTAPFFLGIFAMFGGRNLDKLQQKNRQVLKTSKFKQDFLANMSHEIRTPMVGVIGMIDLLLKNTELSSIQKEYVTTIHQSSLNLLNILNQILDLSKIEAGKFVLSPESVNYRVLINQNVNLFLAPAKAKGIDIHAEYDEALSDYILVDSNRLTQIISNLIGNAIKFTSEGTIQIKSSLLSKKEDQLQVKIEIIDSGIGISKVDQKRLFSRFSQFDDQTIYSGEGTGLGLSICKKLVSLMGGKIGVKSELDRGSTFWFTFNAHTAPHQPTAPISSKTTSQKNITKFDLHVLLVEDSETNILVTKQILKYLGCTVEVAKTGREAVETFKEEVYDLILMDINLPQLDGIQASKLIRKNHKNVPPIFALTSNALPGDAERFIAKGLDDYITKPFTTEILNIKLKNWFSDYHQFY